MFLYFTCGVTHASNLRFVSMAVFGVVIVVQASLCSAEIYKCTGAGGRVIIGDQPCVQSSADAFVAVDRIKTAPATTPAARAPDMTDKERASLVLVALEERILLMHGPECRELRGQLKRRAYLADGLLGVHRPISADDKVMWEHYQTKCLPQAKDVVALSVAQQEGAKREISRKVLCDHKALEYDRRKKAGPNFSELEAQALAVLASEVARGCR